MAIPDYQTIMLPLLKFAGDNEEHSLQQAVENLADYFELTEASELTSDPQFGCE